MDDELRRASAEGRACALALDARLRAEEEADREARLVRATAIGHREATRQDVPQDTTHLQARVAELLAFRRAVQASRVWKAAQALRRVLGRAW